MAISKQKAAALMRGLTEDERNEAILDAPNCIDARAVFEKRQKQVRLAHEYRRAFKRGGRA